MFIGRYSFAAIPGEKIGLEVVPAALKVLRVAAKAQNFEAQVTNLPWGTTFYKETGSYLPSSFLTILKPFDAILFGAVGATGTLNHRAPPAF